MDYSIQAIETKYRGITFRSRLEATWAAMFDLLGWSWEYETDPINGWLPDFMIKAKAAPDGMLFVEVKPVFEFPADVGKRIAAAAPGRELLLLGLGPYATTDVTSISIEAPEPAALGWLGEVYVDLTDSGTMEIEDGMTHTWFGEAILDAAGGYGVMHQHGSYHNRMTGEYEGRLPIAGVDMTVAMSMWGAAKKQVRYLPK